MNKLILNIILLKKNPADDDYSSLTKEIQTNPKAPKFKVGDRIRITKRDNIFSKSYKQKWS